MVVVLATLLLLPAPASAFHDDKEFITDYTAWTLEPLEVKIGLWDVAFAPAAWLTLDTYVWPWFLKVGNLSAKWRIWHNPDWAVSAKAGFFYLDVQRVKKDANPATLGIVPLELALSRRIGASWWVSAGLVYTAMVAKGTYDESDLRGAAGFSNAQALLALEWRLHRRWALFLRTRHLLYMDLSGQVHRTTELDDYTTVELHASAGAGNVAGLGFPQTFQVVPGIAYSGRVFNVELGLGYGNLNIPGVNFLMPNKSVVPQLDLYWRF